MRTLEGIIDVGCIVVAHFDNPVQKEMIEFLEPVLEGKQSVGIPNSTFMGAFHILTSYLRVSPIDAKKSLMDTFRLESPCFIADIHKEVVTEALELATYYKVESWDGYMVALAKIYGTKIIYTIDKRMKKISEIVVKVPVEEEKMKGYHEWLREKLE
jgi:predicted nucleic acid-binding protein